MSSLRQFLTGLLTFYHRTRGVGHTSSMMRAVVDMDIVAAGSADHAKTLYAMFRDSGRRNVRVVYPAVMENGLMGLRAPLHLDNFFVMKLAQDALNELEAADEKVAAAMDQAATAQNQLYQAQREISRLKLLIRQREALVGLGDPVL